MEDAESREAGGDTGGGSQHTWKEEAKKSTERKERKD